MKRVIKDVEIKPIINFWKRVKEAKRCIKKIIFL
jgi:hypothetical protein